MKLKPGLTKKRLAEIEKLQDGIRTLCGEFKKDFSSDPPALFNALETDIDKAIESLELLKNFYKAKTEKKG